MDRGVCAGLSINLVDSREHNQYFISTVSCRCAGRLRNDTPHIKIVVFLLTWRWPATCTKPPARCWREFMLPPREPPWPSSTEGAHLAHASTTRQNPVQQAASAAHVDVLNGAALLHELVDPIPCHHFYGLRGHDHIHPNAAALATRFWQQRRLNSLSIGWRRRDNRRTW